MSTYGFQKLVVGGTAVGFDESIINPVGNPLIKPAAACFVVENAPVRVRTDGGTPTSTDGIPLSVGQFVELESERDVESFKAIAQDSMYSATLSAQFSTSTGER